MVKNMSHKSFLVKVELTIQKISCPGVWLCSNGKVSLQLCMLDSDIQTESYKPLFPVIFNEKFVFGKSFLKERRLNELHRSLTREWFCVELIQWKNCDEGVVLANFRSTLDDLLYPSSFSSSKTEGTDVDVLLEPTKLFPGTISPKLELRTKTTIEESFPLLSQKCSDRGSKKNMHKIACCIQRSSRLLHPKSVCHTVAYSRAQHRCPNPTNDKKPIFKYTRPEDDLILRLNPNNVVKNDVLKKRRGIEYVRDEKGYVGEKKSSVDEVAVCYCGEYIPLSSQENTNTSFVKIMKRTGQKSCSRSKELCSCSCGKQHHRCPICAKYECTFLMSSSKPRDFLSEPATRTASKLCSHCQENYDIVSSTRCACEERDTVVSASEKKVCFCLPKEKTCTLAQRLHDRLTKTVQDGATSIESCLGNCEVCD